MPQTTGRKSHHVPMDSLIQWGDSFPRQVGARASDAQRNPVRHRNQLGNSAHQTGENPDSNSGLPEEAEGEVIS
jgi:hypothetical protein